MRVDNCIPPPIFDIVGGAVNSVVNAAVNSVDNGGVELTQRVIINSFDVDLNAIWQTTAEGTQEKRRDHNITVSRASSNIEKKKGNRCDVRFIVINNK